MRPLPQILLAPLGRFNSSSAFLHSVSGSFKNFASHFKAELEAEETQEILAEDHVKSLALFDQFIRENADEPERIKAAITRLIDYVVWHAGEKGEGQLEVSIFSYPVAMSPEAIDFDSAVHGEGRCFVPGSEMVGATGLEPVTSWV